MISSLVKWLMRSFKFPRGKSLFCVKTKQVYNIYFFLLLVDLNAVKHVGRKFQTVQDELQKSY